MEDVATSEVLINVHNAFCRHAQTFSFWLTHFQNFDYILKERLKILPHFNFVLGIPLIPQSAWFKKKTCFILTLFSKCIVKKISLLGYFFIVHEHFSHKLLYSGLEKHLQCMSCVSSGGGCLLYGSSCSLPTLVCFHTFQHTL